VRPPLLVDLSAAESRESEAGHGAHVVTKPDSVAETLMIRFDLDDDLNDDPEEDEDDVDEDEDEEDEEDDEDDEDEDTDTETWQVSAVA
jgi:hypothetical protein